MEDEDWLSTRHFWEVELDEGYCYGCGKSVEKPRVALEAEGGSFQFCLDCLEYAIQMIKEEQQQCPKQP